MGEASALLLACQKLRPYLLAGIFILKSDSLSISFLHHLQDCKGFFFRLYQTLSGFRFHLHHVQGKRNLADFWSRTRHLPEMSDREAEALLPIDIDIMAELQARPGQAKPNHDWGPTKPNPGQAEPNQDWEPRVEGSKPNLDISPPTNMSGELTVGGGMTGQGDSTADPQQYLCPHGALSSENSIGALSSEHSIGACAVVRTSSLREGGAAQHTLPSE